MVFDDERRHDLRPGARGRADAAEAIARVHAGGSTNLSGGWLKGRKLVEKGMVEGTNRVVLLTDGQANVGIVDPAKLLGLASRAPPSAVSTTCIGFGAGFNEDLLEPMARAGARQLLVRRVGRPDGRDLRRRDRGPGRPGGAERGGRGPAHPSARRRRQLPAVLPGQQTAEGGWRVALHDLYATSPKALALVFHVEDVRELGKVPLGEVRIEADVVHADGIEHRTIVMPVVANLDGEDQIEPTVEQTFLRFQAARAREEAVRRADEGDFDAAAACLARRGRRARGLPDAPGCREEIEDLRAEAAQLDERRYDAADRKYQGARAMAARELKADYAQRVSRRRPSK